MADIDPQLSPHLCSALSVALSKDWNQTLTCVDVSRRQLAWDLEARDSEGTAILYVSHTRAPWVEARKAEAEMNDIRVALEQDLATDALRDLVISLMLHQPPTSSSERQRFAVSLVGYVRAAAERLRDAPFGTGVDVRAIAEDNDDPRAVELYTALSEFRVDKIELGGPAMVVAHDTRLFRWQPPVSSAALPRVGAKVERHGMLTKDLVLLIEAEDVDMAPDSIADLRNGLTDEHRVFRAIYVCNRNHTLNYDVVRVY